MVEYIYYQDCYKYFITTQKQENGEAHSNFLKDFKSFIENERMIILSTEAQ